MFLATSWVKLVFGDWRVAFGLLVVALLLAGESGKSSALGGGVVVTWGVVWIGSLSISVVLSTSSDFVAQSGSLRQF